MHPYFTIFGEQFPAYGIMMLTGAFLAVFFACLLAPRKGFDRLDILLTATFGFVVGILGAKLLFILGEVPDYISHIKIYGFQLSWLWNEIMTAGLVFYGGLIGGIFGGWIYVKMFRLDFWRLADYMLPFLPLAHGFGRLGCTFAGCCFGIELDPPLGIHFPHSLAGANPDLTYAPTQLWEAIFCLAILFPILMWFCSSKRKSGAPVGLYALLYGIFRFIEEFFRDEQTVGGSDWGPFTVSQLISLLLIAIGIMLLLGAVDKARERLGLHSSLEPEYEIIDGCDE